MKSNNSQFFAIWAKYCATMRVPTDERDSVRREFITQYFPNKSSFKELTGKEVDYLIHKLNEMTTPAEMPTAAYQDGQQMRRKIIAILCELYNFRKEKNGEIVPDMAKINDFLKKKTAFKCDLNSLTIEQLPKVVTQIDELEKNERKAKRKKMEVENGSKPL